MDRRFLLDDEETPIREPRNVFSDEFEVDDFDTVADGFRPDMEGEEDTPTPHDDTRRDEPIRTISAHYASNPVSPTIPTVLSRNSTRKSQGAVNPFASLEDGETSPLAQPMSLQFEPDNNFRRSTSSASSHVYAGTSSPGFGAGPSHPYGMYQQGTLARTLSAATASTTRATRRQSYLQTLPQHPYTMYPQGIDDDLDDDDEIEPIRPNPVPVGFPGLGQGYTRRIGPDGEDQDIVGEDGHTEQLPPYSRYPEDGPEKVPLLVPTALHSRAPVAGTDPGMPLMHTTLQPSPTRQSMTDASTLRRQPSNASSPTARLLPSSSSDGSSMKTTKSWQEKSWSEKRKTKFCGIPFWWIMLALGVLTFISAVLGGVIGGFVAGGKAHNNVITVTSLPDASPIASPTGVAPPQGTFALTLGQPEEVQGACLSDANQSAAWNCDLVPNIALGLVVNAPVNGKGNGGAYVFYASFDTSIAYGSQLSNMNTTVADFLTVQDNDDPDNGPAFYFQQYYDKIVVIPEDAISIADSSSSKKRRQDQHSPDFRLADDWSLRREAIKPGERPWFCVWNDTFLEGFLYVQEPLSMTTSSSTPLSTSPPPSNTTYQQTGSISTPPATTSAPLTTPPPVSATPPPTIDTTLTIDHVTTAYHGPSSEFPGWFANAIKDIEKQHNRYDNDGDDGDSDDHDASGSHNKRGISPDDPWSQLVVFPYMIKLEERRLPNVNDISPYCQQYQILDDGTANWVPDAAGNPIIVTLTENDPPWGAYQNAGTAGTARRKRTVPGSCHCQWMSGA